jgi:murein L,D-transpeptidase YafK
MKYVGFSVILILGVLSAISQGPSSNSFISYQKSFPRISDVLNRKEDSLKKQFEEKKLPWPAKYIYLRSFKYDSQLEVWVKYDQAEKFKLFKTYKVCALSGSLGPKRMQGDYQVPEGFYYINEFNPKSVYHLSLGLNYPNPSDKLLGDSLQPGGDIYIHGSCVTTGCIPITNQQIEELYILASHAKSEGQDFIPVHIFPVQFKNAKSVGYLNKFLKDFPEYTGLTDEMKKAYQYFDKTKQLPLVLINRKGGYVVEAELPMDGNKNGVGGRKKEPRAMKNFNEDEIAKVVDKLPEYPGGNEGFQVFLDEVSKEMTNYLGEDQPKAYVMVEFIIDKEGRPANVKVIKGGNEDLNEKLEEKFEKMPVWSPAVRMDKNVAVRLKQSIFIERTSKP